MVCVCLHPYSATLALPELQHVAAMAHTVLVSTDEVHVRITVELRCGTSSRLSECAFTLASKEFYHSHLDDPLEQWVHLFDKWHVIPGSVNLPYKEGLRDHYARSSVARYWRLVFAIDSLNSGFYR